MRPIIDALENTLVDFRPLDDDLVVLFFSVSGVAQLHQLARPVAVVGADAGTRVVDAAVLVALGDCVLERIGIRWRRWRFGKIRLEFQAATPRLGDHPDEGNVGQRIVGIAATDVGMRAREPNLAELLVLDEAFPGRIRFASRYVALVPQLGMEGGSFLVQRQRVTGARHPVAGKRVSGKLEWPDVAADAAGHFIKWRAIGGDGVPYTD